MNEFDRRNSGCKQLDLPLEDGLQFLQCTALMDQQLCLPPKNIKDFRYELPRPILMKR